MLYHTADTYLAAIVISEPLSLPTHYAVRVVVGPMSGHAEPADIPAEYDPVIGERRTGFIGYFATHHEAETAAILAARKYRLPIATAEMVARAREQADRHNDALASAASQRRDAAEKQAATASADLWATRGLGPNPTATAKKRWRRAHREAQS